ncbi:MAG TPA: SUF system Fe-S cluster assembly regulator [Alphaproteobacteria bacterium]|nr:SUF system Fe-S cluster assembly regulator [Alphaproteobacteria bacterium]
MIRLSKLTDYAVVMLSHMAAREKEVYTTCRLADRTAVPEPTAAKILKSLAKSGILVSLRGSNGGYELARPAAAISVAEIIVALDGPIALAACVDGSDDHCGVESLCSMRGNWNRVNRAIRSALEEITLADMAAHPFTPPPPPEARPAESLS